MSFNIMNSQKPDRQVFVDMEQKLLDDSSGVYRKELINTLLKYESDVNVMIHAAVSDGDLFERLNLLKKGIQQAKETIEKF